MTPTSLPPVYIRVVRLAQVGPDHLHLGGPARDRIELHHPEGMLFTDHALTVAEESPHPDGAPIVVASWTPGAMVIGPHGKGKNQRDSLVNWARPLPFRRPGGPVQRVAGTGLNLHSRRGVGYGCLMAPEWWVVGAIAILRELGFRDRETTIGVLVEEPQGPNRRIA